MNGWIVVVDTETTGLEPQRHEVIDTHVLLVDEQLVVRYEAGGRSPLLRPEVANPEALRVNGYNAAEWAKTQRPLIDVLLPCVQLIDMAEWWLGSNPQFDVRFIDAACRSVGLGVLRAKKLIDTKQIANAMGVWGTSAKGRRSQGLEALAGHFGIRLANEHSARVDCYLALEVYRRLMASGGEVVR